MRLHLAAGLAGAVLAVVGEVGPSDAVGPAVDLSYDVARLDVSW